MCFRIEMEITETVSDNNEPPIRANTRQMRQQQLTMTISMKMTLLLSFFSVFFSFLSSKGTLNDENKTKSPFLYVSTTN